MSIRKIGKNDLQRYFELCNEENWGIGFARIEKMVLGFDFDYFYFSVINKPLTLTRPLRRKLRISADSSLIRQNIGTFFI